MPLKKLSFIALFIIVYHGTAYSKVDFYGRKHYHIALHVNTPTGLMTKYGGGLEYRYGGSSILYSYDKYMGAYPGFQTGMEWQIYLRTHKKHQSYIYIKGVLGDAGYDGSKITLFGYGTDIKIADYAYVGGGVGYGRRWNFNIFFITFSTGLKYCALDPSMTPDERNMYTLFYYTGPGSYIDAHFQFGIQF
jgi:hypothetical protein